MMTARTTARTPIAAMTRRLAALGVTVGLALAGAPGTAAALPTSELSHTVTNKLAPKLRTALARENLELGSAMFVRIYKQEKLLEVWMETAEGRFEPFKTYRICAYSGGPGPKEQEGDLQSPEGFYAVKASGMNPRSAYHLSFNLGFPNAYDRAHGRTGYFLMVHGSCVSQGCYAMTDGRMEEIYTLAEAAFAGGQDEIPVHIFPFKMTRANLDSTQSSRWFGFWSNLKEGHDIFEQTRVPPMVWVENARYAFYRRGRILHRAAMLPPVPDPAPKPAPKSEMTALDRAAPARAVQP